MKFSDMMGKGDQTAGTEVSDTETAVPPAPRHTPPAPEAPIRFGEARTDAPSPSPEPPLTAGADTVTEAGPPSMRELVSELAPRRPDPATAASGRQLDATAWLEGLPTVMDDLLPS